MKGRTRLIGGVLALAIATVGGYEGLRLATYKDIVGVPTVCYGETRGVKMSDRYTKSECDAMLGDGLRDFEAGMRKCIKEPDKIPDKSYVAILSLAYNIGQGAICKSTLVRKLNAGDVRGACNEFPKWNKAGGKTVKGLTRRRAEEKAMCLEGVAEGAARAVVTPAPEKPVAIPTPRPSPVPPIAAPAPTKPEPPAPSFWDWLWSWFR